MSRLKRQLLGSVFSGPVMIKVGDYAVRTIPAAPRPIAEAAA